MTNEIKITTDEQEEFNKITLEIQKNIFEFGELYYEKLELESLYKKLQEKEDALRKRSSEIKDQEAKLMEKILQKYGEGSLNIKNGVFVPTTPSKS